MKRLAFFFSSIVCIGSILVSSCDKSPLEPTPEEPSISPDSTLLRLSANLEFTTEPLGVKTKGASNDLYGVRVYQYFGLGDTYGEGTIQPEPSLAAYGVFDNLEQVVVKLSKKYIHEVDVIYIPNGKNLVQEADKGYELPFFGEDGPLNTLRYEGLTPTYYYVNKSGAVSEKGYYHLTRESEWSTVQRYQGTAFIDPSTMSEVNVELHSTMIGFRIEITEFEKGTVRLSSASTEAHTFTATPDENHTGHIDVEVNKENIVFAAPYGKYDLSKTPEENHKDKMRELSESVSYDYVILSYSDGNDFITLYQKYLPTDFNTRYCMSFSLSDALTNGGITATVKDSEMTEVNIL